MTTIRALADGEEKELELLGELHAIKGAPTAELTIRKPVTIPGAGSYRKDFIAPLYTRRVMEEGSRRSQEPWDLSSQGCLGMLLRKGKNPIGYVRRQLGPHNLCVPVYSVAGKSSLFWQAVGYLPAGKGYVTVAKRRVAYWVCLAVAAAAAFGAAYLLFRYDIQTLGNTLRDLPGLLSAKFFKALRDWGIL